MPMETSSSYLIQVEVYSLSIKYSTILVIARQLGTSWSHDSRC